MSHAKRTLHSDFDIRPAQTRFIEELLNQRDVPGRFSHSNSLDKFHKGSLDSEEASVLIDALKALPRVHRGGRAAGRTADLPEVPAGQYVIRDKNQTHRYRVRHGIGHFHGWTYIDVELDGSFCAMVGTAQARRILEVIHQDLNKQ